MIGIPFIKQLFGAILAQSKVINGRFYICPFWGTELNKGNLDEVIPYVKPIRDTDQKYPAALLMPMRETGNFQYENDPSPTNAYGTIECTMVFLTNAYVTGQNQISSPAPDTKVSTHTIPDTWHDMKRCADNFMKVLQNGIEAQFLQTTIFINPTRPQELLEVVSKGNDQVSGVLLRFYINLASGCSIEDYNSDYLTSIAWPNPSIDVHPLHLDV